MKNNTIGELVSANYTDRAMSPMWAGLAGSIRKAVVMDLVIHMQPLIILPVRFSTNHVHVLADFIHDYETQTARA